MPKRIFFTLSACFVLLSLFCATPPIKDEKSLEDNRKQAEKGDKQSFENYDKALETTAPKDNPDLHKKILDDLATIPGKESEEILKKNAQNKDPKIRQDAVNALYEHNKRSDTPSKSEDETLDLIKENQRNYGGLGPCEISVLGKMKNPESAEILLNQFNIHNLDSISRKKVLNALGKKLTSPDTTEPAKESAKEPSKENDKATEKKARESQRESQLKTKEKVEQGLVDFIVSENSEEQKKTALDYLYRYYGKDAFEKLFTIYQKNPHTQELILQSLRDKPAKDKKSFSESLKKDYLASANKSEREKILKFLKSFVPEEYQNLLKKIKEKKALAKENEKLKKLLKGNQIELLKNLFVKNNLPKALAGKIHARTKALAKDSSIPMKSETVLLFASLQNLYPAKNFFEVKQIGQAGLKTPGLFLAIMETIEKNYSNLDMRLAAIQSLWKVSHYEAARLYRTYRREKSFLKKALR